jgi:ABC-type glycerol-3-phosphate transport system permease component
MINEERWKTLPLGLLTYQRQFTAQWGNMMAATTTTILPVVLVFIALQKQVIRGITMGGVKG